MGEAVIRHWHEGDDERVLALFDRTVRWLSDEAYHTKFSDHGLHPQGIIVAEVDGIIVGHLMGNHFEVMFDGRPQRFGGIGQVMVDEAYRGRGLGKGMLEMVIRYHTDADCCGVLLWTQDQLVPAYPLYQKLGFTLIARRVHYRFPPGRIDTHLSVVRCSEDLLPTTEPVREAWMRTAFPVGLQELRPGPDGWWLVLDGSECIGYAHLSEREDHTFVNRAVAYPARAPEVCDAFVNHLVGTEHPEAVWQTTVDSLWADALEECVEAPAQPHSDVRMCLALASPIDTANLRPEFDGCSTW